jgi:glycogen debranching enzyme
MRISVGPPILTINHNNTFMVTDLAGQVQPEKHLGIFSDDTRFLSYYACYIDGHPWTRITSTTTTYYAAQVYLVNPAFIARQGPVEAGTIALVINRVVEAGTNEELQLTNYGSETVSFNLELVLRSDFADIFEVESGELVRRGRIETQWNSDKRELSTTYTNEDYYRRLTYQIRRCSSSVHSGNGRIVFEVTLEPGETWHTSSSYILSDNEHTRKVSDYSYEEAINLDVINTEIERLHQMWCQSATKIASSNSLVQQVYQQSVADLGALRLYDYDAGPDIWIAAAGVPKFVTLFGRDSLITSLQTMVVHPSFALGALHQLAKRQATDYDDWRDSEPGKILHEVRQGELAKLQQIPHTPYYGTADATALFLITLHESWKWLGDDSLLRGYWEWIDRYGDLDNDGFQEYKKRSSSQYGIEN